jgi:predicted RNA-binding protein with RPS1 domain
MKGVFRLAAVFAITLLTTTEIGAFVNHHPLALDTPKYECSTLLYETSTAQDEETQQKACYYRAPVTNEWKPRIDISNLKVGQPLNGTVVQELLDGTTGPKIYLDCGVCRRDKYGKWQIANGMMRLGDGGTHHKKKASVTRKRATRLRQRAVVPVIVSRIYPSCAQFEVVTDDVVLPEIPLLIPASTLQPGQELVGTVTKVLPFGVFVDVGANRRGLLHIQKVADLYQHYIDKEKGLEQAGLERGARIRVAVLENERKRLFLDFTKDVKQQAAQQVEAEAAEKESDSVVETTMVSEERIPVEEKQEQSGEKEKSSYASISDEEAAAWAAYAGMEEEEEEHIYEEDNDDYDEDKDIEDALGLGSY